MTILGLAGCSNPEENRAQQIDIAFELADAGAYAEALQILEALLPDYPNDPEILKSMARIYTEQGEHTTAAFFLEQAHVQQPEDIELLYETYQAKKAAGEPTGPILEKLAGRSNGSMTHALWIELGQQRAEQNQIESALEAYLRGVDPDNQTPAPETASAIGELFAKLDNQAQAGRWFEMAVDNDSPAALTALFGLLEIQIRQKKWSEAEATIDRLNRQFPGALEASEWQQASQEIKRWRAKQEAMQAMLAAQKAAEEAAEEIAMEAADAEKTDVSESAETTPAAEASEATPATETDRSDTKLAADPEQPGMTVDKSQVVADLAEAEAMANQPALEPAAPNATDEAAAGNITFNPNIAITPIDPDLSLTVAFDEENSAPATRYTIESEPAPEAAQQSPVTTVEMLPSLSTAPARPKTMEEFLAEAKTAEIDREYKTAIRKYWAAISIVNNRAELWNQLSRAYLIDGQLKNAETTALEAVRLDPREVAYTLDFLRVAQRSRPPQEFLAQLKTAYDRFPSSPELALSLARAHERISQNNFVARNLYLRFVDIAPNHPLVPEARAAAARLR